MIMDVSPEESSTQALRSKPPVTMHLSHAEADTSLKLHVLR